MKIKSQKQNLISKIESFQHINSKNRNYQNHNF
jgi:hypothetical protein